eukprot:2197282-Pyramimonas_sp.AAC.1
MADRAVQAVDRGGTSRGQGMLSTLYQSWTNLSEKKSCVPCSASACPIMVRGGRTLRLFGRASMRRTSSHATPSCFVCAGSARAFFELGQVSEGFYWSFERCRARA